MPYVWVAADARSVENLPESVRAVQWYGLPDTLAAAATTAYGVLVDSFRIGADEFERIAGVNLRIAVIDDFPRRQYSTGVVVDWTVGAEHFAFPARHAGDFPICLAVSTALCARSSGGPPSESFPIPLVPCW